MPVFQPSETSHRPHEGKNLRIKAIFVYNDPRDMGLDLQLVTDLLLSHRGFVGTVSEKKDYLTDEQPKLYIANPDRE